MLRYVIKISLFCDKTKQKPTLLQKKQSKDVFQFLNRTKKNHTKKTKRTSAPNPHPFYS